MDVILNVTHITRHDTEENWGTQNPILKAGEMGYVDSGTHAGMFKIGDGSSHWNVLPFIKAVASGGNADTISNISLISDNKIDPQYLPTEHQFGNYKVSYNSTDDSLDISYIGS